MSDAEVVVIDSGPNCSLPMPLRLIVLPRPKYNMPANAASSITCPPSSASSTS